MTNSDYWFWATPGICVLMCACACVCVFACVRVFVCQAIILRHTQAYMYVSVKENNSMWSICSRQLLWREIESVCYTFQERAKEAPTILCLCYIWKTLAFEFIMADMCFGRNHQMEESFKFHTCLKDLKLYPWLLCVLGLWQSECLTNHLKLKCC